MALGVKLRHAQSVSYRFAIDVSEKGLFLDMATPAHDVTDSQSLFAFCSNVVVTVGAE
jgi:hypothetical protein